ncbi:cytochrome P450 [Sediminibacillus halophilus]|uniref:Fatty-acid peroxygenase n=1 Tax=Sediminibacillus halophilus TaxID=482461 RepID=A0A1G9R9E9_9BACI|nr:cytochrome P450 [Sediminibacillus halophilus]SDM19912.1 fatty-acid peroxygenase [Sediminibacillus halophilus]
MALQKTIPKETGIDHSLDLLREGYMFIPNRRHSFQQDLFATRLLGQRAVCMGGKEAAEIFYDETKFKRSSAAPKRVQKTLFGEKGVQTLDGKEHRHRKQMFMSLMEPEQLELLHTITYKHLDLMTTDWEKESSMVMYEEAKKLMTRVACEWAGIPLWASELDKRAKDLGTLIESSVSMGVQYRKGKNARKRSENWMKDLIAQVRNKERNPEEDTALYTIAWHRDLQGKLLEPDVAAVELLNIIRPIVAIAIYISFTTLALHQFPEQKYKLEESEGEYYQLFVQEVRRYYPFFPFAGARVKEDFTWRGYHFKKGMLTLLDLYGTNHDVHLWENPDKFYPERFTDWEGSPFDFIPQGGGNHYLGHRCAGEWVTIQVMKVVLDYLVNRLDYHVPLQDLSFSMVSMPSIPKSGIKLSKVEKV